MGAVSIPALLGGFKLSASPNNLAATRGFNNTNGKVLVLVQMIGGNDGLNTLVPLDQYAQLAHARQNILLPENSLLSLDDTLGLHPAMNGIKSMYDDAKVCMLQNVGYPNPNRSHFRSMEIWSHGSPSEEIWKTGWLGRYFEHEHPGYPEEYPNAEEADPFALTIGNIVSDTCQGTVSNYSLALSNPSTFSLIDENEQGEFPGLAYGDELQFLQETILQSNAYADRIIHAADAADNMVDYPNNNMLANQLRNVARLIAGGLGTKVYVTHLPGFDTHAGQALGNDPTQGTHAALLKKVSEAIAAFQADLAAHGLEEQVISMAFSEFGRQIASNHSLGTDHGEAAPVMLFGSCVNAGILGDNPTIPDDPDPQTALPMQFDFRDVYGSILMDWFGANQTTVEQLLYGGFQHLPIIQGCGSGYGSESDPERIESGQTEGQYPNSPTHEEGAGQLPPNVHLTCYPNPFRSRATVRFRSQEEWVRLSVYNSVGQSVSTLVNQKLQAGEHILPLQADNWPTGNYFIRLQLGRQQYTRGVIKF